LLFPPFSQVLLALRDVVSTPSFAAAARLTLGSYLAGLALAVVAGVGLGLLMGLVRPADQLLNLWLNIFLSALVPVIMIHFGMGAPTVVATVFMFAVWIIALDTRAGVLHVSLSLLEMPSSFGASRPQRLKIILLAPCRRSSPASASA
jgi:NitT/TauT family transport system permease protein